MSDDKSFRDAVIAGLRERGWPEPPWFAELGDAVGWRRPGDDLTLNPRLIMCLGGWCVDGVDDLESGRLTLLPGLSVARVVEAIDRLRWVLDLPQASKEMLPLPPARRMRPADVDHQIMGRHMDEVAGLQPLPKEPGPKADPPFVPRKIGEF